MKAAETIAGMGLPSVYAAKESVNRAFETSLAEGARFEVHIAACEHCSAYLEQMRVTLRVVGHIDPDELEPEVERELLDAFRTWKAGG